MRPKKRKIRKNYDLIDFGDGHIQRVPRLAEKEPVPTSTKIVWVFIGILNLIMLLVVIL